MESINLTEENLEGNPSVRECRRSAYYIKKGAIRSMPEPEQIEEMIKNGSQN